MLVDAVTMLARVGAMIVEGAVAMGAPREAFTALGLDAKTARDPDARIELALESALWEAATRLTGEPAFGLRMAEALQPGTFDVLDYAIRTAPSAMVALERLARYNRLIHDVAAFTLTSDGPLVRIEHGFRTTGSTHVQHPASADFTIASLVVVGRQITRSSPRVHAVGFQHVRPASVVPWREFFGVEPRFELPKNLLVLEREWLERPLPDVDVGLGGVLERHVQALLAQRPLPAESTIERVRRVALEQLREGTPTLDSVADQLSASRRTVQRWLAAEGETFEGLLESLRRELALRYLKEQRLAIAEVAYLLGFSEPSAFHRAFKRWTGRTPAEMRAA